MKKIDNKSKTNSLTYKQIEPVLLTIFGLITAYVVFKDII